MAVHTITTTFQRIYTPKKPTMVVISVAYTTPYMAYVGADKRRLTDYGILGADIIVCMNSPFKFLATEPLYAMTNTGSINMAVMEV